MCAKKILYRVSLSLGKTTSVCDCFMFCCLKPERSTWKKHRRACVVGLMAGGVKVPKEAAAMSPRQQEEPNDQGDQDEVDNDKLEVTTNTSSSDVSINHFLLDVSLSC